MRLSVAFSIAGALLALGAPLGALVLRMLTGNGVQRELGTNAFFYAYMAVGTTIAFGLFGFAFGRRIERLEQAEHRLRKLAESDALTRLGNVARFQRIYGRAVEHARRFAVPLSLVFLDVDHLKEINDRWGHGAGSAALVHVATIIAARKREVDEAARWGGDEFAVLLPGAPRRAAERLAHAIFAELHDRPLHFQGNIIPVTVTLGVATLGDLNSGGDLFTTADELLARGKREGRNRVVTTPEQGDHGSTTR